jgi:hypothetical protein
MKDYILIKLRSGEEIVASIISKNRSGIKLFRPMQIRQVPFMDHVTGVLKAASVMENWIGRTDSNEVTVPNSWIGIKMDPAKEVVEAYERYKKNEDTPKNTSVERKVEVQNGEETKQLEEEMNKLVKEMSDAAGIPPNLVDDISNFSASLNSQLDKDKDVVVVNFMIPGKMFKNLVEDGFIDDLMDAGNRFDDIDEDDLEDDVDEKQKKTSSEKDEVGDLGESGKETWGNSFRDWSPDPKDYQ